MNRETYMRSLGHHLRRLPKEDYDRAIAYFEEYFEEAGAEQEEEAIKDLGTPEMAANQIIQDLASQNAAEESKSVKRGISKVWVGILAVFAAPIALPLAFAMVMLIFSLLLVVGSLLFAAITVVISVVIAIIPCAIGGIWLLFTSPADGVATLGMSLIAFGVGVWVVKGCIWFCKWLLNKMNHLIGSVIKRGKRYAK